MEAENLQTLPQPQLGRVFLRPQETRSVGKAPEGKGQSGASARRQRVRLRRRLRDGTSGWCFPNRSAPREGQPASAAEEEEEEAQ